MVPSISRKGYRAAVGIGFKEMRIGLNYAALIRVKALNILILKPVLDYNRLRKIGDDALIERRLLETKLFCDEQA